MYQTHEAEMNAGAEGLWPEMFSYKDLYLRRRSNYVAFEKMYQNRIVSSEDQKFREEWLQAALEKGKHLRVVKALSAESALPAAGYEAYQYSVSGVQHRRREV